MLLLALGSLAIAHIMTPPTYQANGSILLFVPPVPGGIVQNPGKGITANSVLVNNPYLGLGDLNITVDIVSNILNTNEESQILRAQGVKGTYSITPDNSTFHGPIVDISSKADAPAAATQSTKLVMDELARQLAAIQKQQGTDPKYFVKVSTINAPEGAIGVRPLTKWLLVLGILEFAAIVAAAWVADKLAARKADGGAAGLETPATPLRDHPLEAECDIE